MAGLDFDFYQFDDFIRTEGLDNDLERIGDFDPVKIVGFIPTFVGVFASIILAQLLSPLMSQLLMSVLGFVPMALSSKRPIIDAILAPFDLMLCDRPGGRSFSDSFRSLERELGWSETQANMAATFAETAFETISSKYQS